MAKNIRVEIVGDASSLERAFSRAQTSASGFGSRLGRVGKLAALTAGGAGLGALAVTLKAGIEDWAQGAKVAAQTEAVLKSTKSAANVTAKQIDALSLSLMRKSGMDDDAIKSGENLLLTFTNIRNAAGRGNDIFSQTTKIMTDMSVALGQDTKSSAIQLGKALNDPIKGLTALQRVGVSFTASQKEQIKALVESGNTLGAQKLILGELNKEFGGSAEAVGKTLPGQIAVLRESFSNLAGNLVGTMIPTLQRLVSWVNTNWPTIQAVMAGVFAAVGWAITNVLAPAISLGIDIGKRLVEYVRANWGEISAKTREVFDTVRALFQSGSAVILGIWGQFGSSITAQLRTTWEFVKSYIKGALDIVRGIVNVFAGLLTGDWGRVWQGLKQIVGGVFQEISALARAFGETLRNVLAVAGTAAVDILKAAFNGLKAAVALVVSGILTMIDLFLAGLQKLYQAAGRIPVIGAMFRGVADRIGEARTGVQALQSSIDNLRGKDVAINITTTSTTINRAISEKLAIKNAGRRADGGPVSAGLPYIVGERGQELFVPNVSGRIIPNGAGRVLTARGGTLSRSGQTAAPAPVVNLTVNGWVGSGDELVNKMRNELVRIVRREPNIFGGKG